MRTPNRVLFRGLGGAGQRHLRILKKRFPKLDTIACLSTKKTPVLNSDFTIDQSTTLQERYGVRYFETLDRAYQEEPDLVVIAMPTSMLATESVIAMQNGCTVICEKPGAATNEESKLVAKASKSSSGYYLSYQRQFHPLTQKVNELLASDFLGKVTLVRIRVASYLPGWHPYEDFRELYASRRELGGGVLRTEIHELFWLLEQFGMPGRVSACASPNTWGLNVEAHTSFVLEYPNFLASVDLCFMQQKQERVIEVNGTEGWLSLDLQNSFLQYSKNGGETTRLAEDIKPDDLFLLQLDHWLSSVEPYNYSRELEKTMRIIEEVEKAASDGRKIE